MSPSYDFPTEVFLHIGLYLNRQQLINSALVSKSWNAVFEPLVWSHLEIGSDKATSRIKVEDIRSKAPWIRSLAFKDFHSAVQFYSIGKGCTRLRSLALPITRSKEAVERGYWKVCKDLVKQNKATLVSLSLTFMPLTASNWNPLLSISQYPHSTLRSLRLENCKLPYRHLAAFWDVCERLEVLELHKVPFEPPYSYKVHEKAFGPKERPGWKVPFSNLLELILDCSGPRNSLTQLEVVIREAPKLKKLCWNIEEGAWFPITRFMYLFSGQEEYHYAPEPQNPDMTDQEIQDMSRAVFKQLGRLHKLRILDLSDDRNNPGWPLQFTESMGLASLSSLTELETLVLQGDQNMIPGDVDWMLEHWKSLKVIDGGMMAAQHYGRDCTLATMFNKRGIKTPRSVYPDEYLSNFGKNETDKCQILFHTQKMLQNRDLPNELYLQIGIYLNRCQLASCSLVCKSWNAAFGAQVWSRIELSSVSSIIQLTFEELSSKASCIRALEFLDCESTIRFSPIGKNCTQLRALSITTNGTSHRKDYWRACEEFIREIPRTLESLTLKRMPIPELRFKNGCYNWTPLLNVVQYPHPNLRTLRLESYVLPCVYIDAFWDLCERVQVLELQDVSFELPRLTRIQKRTKGVVAHQPRIVQFSNLRELTLIRSGPLNSLVQLEGIISGAPKLKKLYWTTRSKSWFPATRFIYLFTGQERYYRVLPPRVRPPYIRLEPCTAPSWPDLESLEDFVQKVLSSFPMLIKGHFQSISAQKFVDGGDSWVCFNSLEELKIQIKMYPQFYAPPRSDMTDQEKQEMSWAVFKQLAKFRNLRILDITNPRVCSSPTPQFTTSMGLPLLSSLTDLEVLRLEGEQDLAPQDVTWMIENWKSLRIVDAMKLAQNRTRFKEKNYWNYALADLFNKHGIKTPRSAFAYRKAGKRFSCDELDWSHYPYPPGDDGQAEVNPLEQIDVDFF
ncbi:hypothetical protein BGZ80_004606 [Entomortierella chlamydospora]|uniref:F-box domain-containing protein n=1 Tax=Entomortierella chlamydospora TaxID=101097 RepID=A0A9P6MZZ0_9FUNG|nr:hypothetical protein BGZ80_004606 [Entomortierella chlamydospora]